LVISPAEIGAAAIAAAIEAVASEAGVGIALAAHLHGALRLDTGAFADRGRCICRRTSTIDNDSEQQNEGRALHGDVPPIGILIFSAEAERRPDAPATTGATSVYRKII
jgi:hypothetical protein